MENKFKKKWQQIKGEWQNIWSSGKNIYKNSAKYLAKF